jgi:hypothetical protein
VKQSTKKILLDVLRLGVPALIRLIKERRKAK